MGQKLHDGYATMTMLKKPKYFLLILLLNLIFFNYLSAQGIDSDLMGNDPNSQESIRCASGADYMKQGKYPEAENEFKQAIQANPRFFLGYYGLGTLYLAQKRWEESISVFKDGISFVGFNKRLYLHLAIAYMRSGDLDNAEKAIKAIMAAGADDTNTQRIYWQIQDLKSDKNDAIGGMGFLYIALFFLICGISFIIFAAKRYKNKGAA